MTIYKGKNVDEAIEKGLAALNLKKNYSIFSWGCFITFIFYYASTSYISR